MEIRIQQHEGIALFALAERGIKFSGGLTLSNAQLNALQSILSECTAGSRRIIELGYPLAIKQLHDTGRMRVDGGKQTINA